ncbi:MAG: hypothetical protein HDT37_01900 [Clostridiales bacterium]|nr:hypothetical protein [Clostridiales bacterium]
MHLSDLKALQAAKAWKYFLYLSENQPGYDCTQPLKASLTFTSMDILAIPPMAAIFLMGMGNYLGLDFVTAVDCEPHVLGDLLKITCKGGKQHIIVAQD